MARTLNMHIESPGYQHTRAFVDYVWSAQTKHKCGISNYIYTNQICIFLQNQMQVFTKRKKTPRKWKQFYVKKNMHSSNSIVLV